MKTERSERTCEEIAREIVAGEVEWMELCGFKVQKHSIQAMERRFASALQAYGDLRAQEACNAKLEEAAKESEAWFELFEFDTFSTNDSRRCANPNQIAARIRHLKSPAQDGGS